MQARPLRQIRLGEITMSEIKDTQQHPKVEIAVKNFGPIAEANIDLRPLTVFVGPSNTGKTYFATLVYALHGLLDGFPRIPLLNFAGLSFAKMVSGSGTSANSIASEEDIRESLENLKISDQSFKFSDLPQRTREDIRSGLTDPKVFNHEIEHCFNIDSVSKLLRSTKTDGNKTSISLGVSETSQNLWAIKIQNFNTEISIEEQVNENILIHPEEEEVFKKSRYLWKHEPLPYIEYFKVFRSADKSKNRQRYYLPAARSGIMECYGVVASSIMGYAVRGAIPTLSSIVGDFMMNLIVYEESRRSDNVPIDTIIDVLETEILTGKITSKRLPAGYPDFFYQSQDVKDGIRIDQGSSMVSELAPLVLFLRSGIKPGDTLIIEEPEAHLHPGAQADMAVILARLVRAGIRVIITTHSDWLLEEIGNLTLEGLIGEQTNGPASWLLPEEVGAWHFQKDKPVKEIAFHPRRGFSPKDYQDVAEGLYNRSVNLQQRYEKQKN